jgi:hypothetical protein
MKPKKVVVTAALTLAVGLVAPGGVFARGRWQDVISPANRGRVRLAVPTGDNAAPERPRSLAPAEPRATARARAPAPVVEDRDTTPATPRVSARVLDHAAGDRLREALAAAQDDPKSAGRISRLIAQAAAEARRNKALSDRVWYWRDPFSPNPRQAIVLTLEAQLEMQLAAARQEAARARVESNAARTEAAMAHVEAARARLDAARAQRAQGATGAQSAPGSSARNGAMVAHHDSQSARAAEGSLAPSARTPRRAPHPASPGAGPGESRDDARRRPARRSVAAASETALARNDSAGAGAIRHRDIGTPHTGGGAESPSTDPATWRSNDPRGIVVVPINNNTPVAALPRKH